MRTRRSAGLGSLLMLGGAWNAETVPRGYGGAASAAWLVIVIVAVAGYVCLVRPRRLCPGLGVAALVGLAIAAIGLTAQGRGVLRDLIGIWPGIAVLRDGQQYVAPLALAEAVGLGAVVTWLLRDLRTAAAGPAVALGLMAALAPACCCPGSRGVRPGGCTRCSTRLTGCAHAGSLTATAILVPRWYCPGRRTAAIRGTARRRYSTRGPGCCAAG